MKELPVDIQHIDKILAKGRYVYVDKTPFAYQLITGGASNFFLSRPRRFGKSLFLDTLAEIFKGNKELFKECAIYHSDYDWEPHPVLAIDLYRPPCRTANEFEESLKRAVHNLAKAHALSIEVPTAQEGLATLLTTLFEKHQQQVVVLVDEYDRPIVHNLARPAVAQANRELLGDFFGTFKSLSKYLRFLFITGISRFSKVSLFSEANHLDDISMYPQYATLMGYTEEELRAAFAEHIQAIAQARSQPGQSVSEEAVLSEIKQWYNGYRFSESEACVYNPFSTLKFMETQKAKSHWYSTGTPSFLIEQIKKHPASSVSLAGSNALESELADVSNLTEINLKALMFQTGYLTIQDWELDKGLEETVYRLNFPNKEVHKAFYNSLVRNLGKLLPQSISEQAVQLQKELLSLDLSGAVETLNIQFAKIPYDAFKEAKEGFYQAILLLCLELSGLKTCGEVHTNLGRIDLVVQQPKHTFIFELKVDQPAVVALDQIHRKRYQERYLKDGKEIVAVALSFSTKTRNIGEHKAGRYTQEGVLLEELA